MSLPRDVVAGSILTVLLTGCSPGSGSPTPSSPATTVTSKTTTPLTTTTTQPSVETLPPGWSLAGRVDTPLPVFRDPADSEPFLTLTTLTDLGSQRVVLLLEGPHYQQGGWTRVLVPVKPTGTEGWVRAADIVLFKVDRWIEVSRTDRTMRLYVNHEPVLETAVAIGRNSHPTPTGRFFVTDSVIIPTEGGPWGPHAFGTSAYSDTITEMNGSDAIIGIHGTNRPGSIGQAASLGCVRVPNDVMVELAQLVSAGVPVVIRD